MQSKSLFSTLVHGATLPAEAVIDDLESACWMLEDGDTAGQDWCAAEGYPGYTSYASLNDLQTRATAFADLVQVLDIEAKIIAEKLHWDLGTAQLQCDSLWVNILGEGGAHSGHIHPNSVLSGTVYIAMPERAGRLKIEDPRLPLMMAAPKLKPDASDDRKRFHYIEPKQGDILIWESWLRHEVTANQSEDPRISISFNYSLND